MKRSSLLLTSSRLLASAFEQPSPKPWRISHRHTCHPATHQSPRVTCPPPHQSPSDTWSKWPTPPSLPPRPPTPKLLPKLMHPFSGSMFTPPLHPLLEEPHDPLNPSIYMPSTWSPSHATRDNHHDLTDHISMPQMRRLLRLAQLDALKERIKKETRDVVTYDELLNICSRMGVAPSPNDATLLVKHLDDAGFIFIFQDTVYLKPRKIAQLMKEVMPQPSSMIKERESILQEMSRLEQEKGAIDKLAYNYSRKVLWSGFGYLILQMALIFHLTFWELSWDVMEPIAYFVTNITLLLGYAFFMITSKHPTYQDLNTVLISSKRKKLMKARKFDMTKFLELQK